MSPGPHQQSPSQTNPRLTTSSSVEMTFDLPTSALLPCLEGQAAAVCSPLGCSTAAAAASTLLLVSQPRPNPAHILTAPAYFLSVSTATRCWGRGVCQPVLTPQRRWEQDYLTHMCSEPGPQLDPGSCPQQAPPTTGSSHLTAIYMQTTAKR